MTNNTNKIQVTCPTCTQVFTTPIPQAEISNNLRTSVVAIAHERLIKCFNNKCVQAFIITISGAQLALGVQPVGPDIVEKVEGSKVIVPSISLVN